MSALSPPPPPSPSPPAKHMYSCDNTKHTCQQDPDGPHGSHATCSDKCAKALLRYRCSEALECIAGQTGQHYNQTGCLATCRPPEPRIQQGSPFETLIWSTALAAVCGLITFSITVGEIGLEFYRKVRSRYMQKGGEGKLWHRAVAYTVSASSLIGLTTMGCIATTSSAECTTTRGDGGGNNTRFLDADGDYEWSEIMVAESAFITFSIGIGEVWLEFWWKICRKSGLPKRPFHRAMAYGAAAVMLITWTTILCAAMSPGSTCTQSWWQVLFAGVVLLTTLGKTVPRAMLQCKGHNDQHSQQPVRGGGPSRFLATRADDSDYEDDELLLRVADDHSNIQHNRAFDQAVLAMGGSDGVDNEASGSSESDDFSEAEGTCMYHEL